MAAAPVPLYTVYRAEDGLTVPGISMAVVTFSAGTIVGLLILGRLASHLGRRAAAIASLALLLVGCLLLLRVHHIGILLAGRLLMGAGTGLAGSSLTSYVVDAAPAKPEWLASVVSSQGPMLGLALGAAASGTTVRFSSSPRQLVLEGCAGVLALSAALVAASPETADPKPGACRSLIPKLGVPAPVRPLLPAAAAIFIATWATGAFYQALVPTLLEQQLRTGSPLLAGLVFAGYAGPSVPGALLAARLAAPLAQRVGMTLFLGGINSAAAALYNDSIHVFIVATIAAGIGQGIAVGATTRLLLKGTGAAGRPAVFSAIYLLSYGGATVLGLVAAACSGTLPLPSIALGYVGLAAAATFFTILRTCSPRGSSIRPA